MQIDNPSASTADTAWFASCLLLLPKLLFHMRSLLPTLKDKTFKDSEDVQLINIHVMGWLLPYRIEAFNCSGRITLVTSTKEHTEAHSQSEASLMRKVPTHQRADLSVIYHDLIYIYILSYIYNIISCYIILCYIILCIYIYTHIHSEHPAAKSTPSPLRFQTLLSAAWPLSLRGTLARQSGHPAVTIKSRYAARTTPRTFPFDQFGKIDVMWLKQ